MRKAGGVPYNNFGKIVMNGIIEVSVDKAVFTVHVYN